MDLTLTNQIKMTDTTVIFGWNEEEMVDYIESEVAGSNSRELVSRFRNYSSLTSSDKEAFANALSTALASYGLKTSYISLCNSFYMYADDSCMLNATTILEKRNLTNFRKAIKKLKKREYPCLPKDKPRLHILN